MAQPARHLALFGAIFFCGVAAMRIVEPHHLVQHIDSPLFSKFLGPWHVKTSDWANMTFELAYATHHACRETATRDFRGKVVFVDNTDSVLTLSASQERDILQCLQDAGAVAEWRIVAELGEPGYLVYTRNSRFANTIEIPMLTSLQRAVKQPMNAVMQGERVVVEITVDENKWQTLFDSAAWFWFWRVFMAALNGVGMLFAAQTIYIHISITMKRQSSALKSAEYPPSTRPPSITANLSGQTNPQMLFGCVIEFCAFGLRAVYLALGPFCSSATLLFSEHIFLTSVTIPLELTSSLISTYLFLCWGALGQRLRNQRRVGLISLVTLSVASIAMQLTMSALQSYFFFSSNILVLVVVNFVLVFVIEFVTVVVFLWFGAHFVRQLAARSAAVSAVPQERRRRLNKAVQWIMISSFAQVVMIIGLGLSVNSRFLFTPSGWFLCLAFVAVGATGVGFAHTAAFRPLSQTFSLVDMLVRQIFSSVSDLKSRGTVVE